MSSQKDSLESVTLTLEGQRRFRRLMDKVALTMLSYDFVWNEKLTNCLLQQEIKIISV